jgi:TP901-1 family phage major tail protein
MAGQAGRGLLVKMDISSTMTTIAGSTSGSISINEETVDITSKDDSGWRTLLAQAGKKSATVQGSGFWLDEATVDAVRAAKISGAAQDFEILIPGEAANKAGSFTFSGIITTLELSGEEGGAVNYSFTVESSGEITWTDLV